MSSMLLDCAKKTITPASTAIVIGAATAFILFATSASQGDTTLIASQYMSALADLASKNTVSALTVAGSFTTAMVYTFITKPAATLHRKCCAKENGAEVDPESGIFTRDSYNTI